MKELHERVKGIIFASPHVRATIKRMDEILKRKPKEAFDKWRTYVQEVNNKEIFDGMRTVNPRTVWKEFRSGRCVTLFRELQEKVIRQMEK